MIVNYRPNQKSDSRFGWTVPKFVGTAVVRNKLKRWIREYLRKNEVKFNAAMDVNVVFKRKTREFYRNMRHKDVEEALKRAFKKIAG